MAKSTLDLSILDDAQDIIVLGKSVKKYVFAAKSSLNFQEQTYRESISNSEDSNAPAFKSCWDFDKQKGIKGSNTFLALRYDKIALRSKGLWIPSPTEARFLDKKAGKLENGIYREYGLAFFDENNPNKEIAQLISAQAEQLKLKFPLIIPFYDLDYEINQSSNFGINIKLVQPLQGIISGGQAREFLKDFDYVGSSGFCRLNRDGVGVWSASWGSPLESSYWGRVDWICGEAKQKNLKEAYNALLKRTDNKKIQELKNQRKEKISAFQDSLK